MIVVGSLASVVDIVSYSLTEEGVYDLKVTAEAEGYKSLTKRLVSSVIMETPVFRGIASVKEKVATLKK